MTGRIEVDVFTPPLAARRPFPGQAGPTWSLSMLVLLATRLPAQRGANEKEAG